MFVALFEIESLAWCPVVDSKKLLTNDTENTIINI